MRWSSAHSLYTSREWAELKAALLLERGDTCQCGCGRRFAGSWDLVAHHVVELNDDNVNDWQVSMNPDNILLVRHACHNRIHERFGGGAYRRAYVVWGSPAAGKSAFVAAAARPGDLVVDIDAIWDALCVGGRAMKPPAVSADVFAVRALLLDRVGTAPKGTSWVVATLPERGERERLAARLAAELLFVDTPKGECLARCAGDAARAGLVEDWWRRYQPGEAPPGQAAL